MLSVNSVFDPSTDSSKEKGMSLLTNGDAYGGKLGGAVGGLDAAVVAFQSEAVMCDSRRLGQVGKHVAHTRVAVEDTALKLDCEKVPSPSLASIDMVITAVA